MSPHVLHQPRVAWDAARTFVSVAAVDDDDLYIWFATQVEQLLGVAYRRSLYETRCRLSERWRLDAPQVQAGTWRARLEDGLRCRPDLAEDLSLLTLAAAARLGRP